MLMELINKPVFY